MDNFEILKEEEEKYNLERLSKRRRFGKPCEGYSSWTDYGYEYDCGYGAQIAYEDCACVGGDYDPETGKKVNWKKYPEVKNND